MALKKIGVLGISNEDIDSIKYHTWQVFIGREDYYWAYIANVVFLKDWMISLYFRMLEGKTMFLSSLNENLDLSKKKTTRLTIEQSLDTKLDVVLGYNLT